MKNKSKRSNRPAILILCSVAYVCFLLNFAQNFAAEFEIWTWELKKLREIPATPVHRLGTSAHRCWLSVLRPPVPPPQYSSLSHLSL